MSRQLLYDGTDQQQLESFMLPLNGQQHHFSLTSFTRLETIENQQTLHALLVKNGVRNHPFSGLVSRSGLALYTTNHEEQQIIVAAGEAQPGRYMLYLEGVFAAASSDSFYPLHYYGFSTSVDSKVTGIRGQAQIDAVNELNYAQAQQRFGRKFTLTADDFADPTFVLNARARPTNLLSDAFIPFGGNFVDAALSEHLQQFELGESRLLAASLIHKDLVLEAYFLNIIASDIVDYTLSRFAVYRGHQFEYDVAPEQISNQQAHKALTATLLLDSLQLKLKPKLLVLHKKPDVLRLVGISKFMVSKRLKDSLQLEGMMGIEFDPKPSCDVVFYRGQGG